MSIYLNLIIICLEYKHGEGVFESNCTLKFILYEACQLHMYIDNHSHKLTLLCFSYLTDFIERQKSSM